MHKYRKTPIFYKNTFIKKKKAASTLCLDIKCNSALKKNQVNNISGANSKDRPTP